MTDKPVAFLYETPVGGHWMEVAKTEHPSVYLDYEEYRNVRPLEVATND